MELPSWQRWDLRQASSSVKCIANWSMENLVLFCFTSHPFTAIYIFVVVCCFLARAFMPLAQYLFDVDVEGDPLGRALFGRTLYVI